MADVSPVPAPILAAGFAFITDAVAAGTLDCLMSDPDCPDCPPVSVSFFIDPTLNVRGRDVRRVATMVQFGETRFGATPIIMPGPGIRGFHTDAGGMGERLMVVQRDGSATFSVTPSGRTLTGTCVDR